MSNGMTDRLTGRLDQSIDSAKPNNKFLSGHEGNCCSCQAGRSTLNATRKNWNSGKIMP